MTFITAPGHDSFDFEHTSFPRGFTTWASTHLARESKRGLVETLLLGVANVRVDDPLERQLLARLELVTEVLCFDGELAAHGVLDIKDGGVEICDRKLVHGSCGGVWGRVTKKTGRSGVKKRGSGT